MITYGYRSIAFYPTLGSITWGSEASATKAGLGKTLEGYDASKVRGGFIRRVHPTVSSDGLNRWFHPMVSPRTLRTYGLQREARCDMPRPRAGG